jgi:hypothetical protein
VKKYMVLMVAAALLAGCGGKDVAVDDATLAEGAGAGPLLSEDVLEGVDTAEGRDVAAAAYEEADINEDNIDGMFYTRAVAAGTTLTYQSRAGVVDLLESVVQYPDAVGYLALESGYRFGDRYVLVVSTGENGASCPATTYAIGFDIEQERVTGSTVIDGCDESVETAVAGNQLSVRKEGEAHVFHNGIVE